MSARTVRIIGISGSLRRSSTNSALVATGARLAGAGVELVAFEGLAEIPPFNPDLDEPGASAAVDGFRRLIARSDAVLISSPEYAHGVPGVLKNALDWLVGSGELIGKPVALINASPRATHAYASLLETLTVMSAVVISEASTTVPIQAGATVEAILADPSAAGSLRAAVRILAESVRAASPGVPG